MRFKFDQIAINSTAKKKPVPEDAAHYIGLEHLIPGTFDIPEWGSEVAPVGEKLLMKKGDVLFGRRRAYQRKVGIAPFDGIFSAHGMVLRPRPEAVDEKYFPFFISSDQFMNEAVRISVGSLSPTINWGTLKNCEFDLPPMDEQKKLAELLWAANDLKESYKKTITATDEMLKAKFREMFGDAGDDSSRGGAETRSKWPMVKLSEIAEYFNGLTYTPNNVVKDAGVIVLRSSNIVGSQISLDDIVRVDCEIKDKLFVRNDDILMCSRNGSAALVGKVAMIKDLPERMTFGAFMMIFRSKYSRFLFEYFKTKSFRDQIKDTQSSVMNQITSKMLANVVVTLPPLSLQREFVAIADKAESAKTNLKKSIAAIDQVMKGLINQ